MTHCVQTCPNKIHWKWSAAEKDALNSTCRLRYLLLCLLERKWFNEKRRKKRKHFNRTAAVFWKQKSVKTVKVATVLMNHWLPVSFTLSKGKTQVNLRWMKRCLRRNGRRSCSIPQMFVGLGRVRSKNRPSALLMYTSSVLFLWERKQKIKRDSSISFFFSALFVNICHWCRRVIVLRGVETCFDWSCAAAGTGRAGTATDPGETLINGVSGLEACCNKTRQDRRQTAISQDGDAEEALSRRHTKPEELVVAPHGMQG